MTAPTLDELRLSWERYLLARVQTIELAGWGSSTTGLLQETVREYRDLEKAYVAAQVARRRARDKAERERGKR